MTLVAQKRRCLNSPLVSVLDQIKSYGCLRATCPFKRHKPYKPVQKTYALRVCGAAGKNLASLSSLTLRFQLFVKLFVSTVYLNTQKYELFCSLLLNQLSHRHSNSFYMRIFPRRILGLQPRDKAAMLVVCWWSIQQSLFSKNLHKR